MRTAVDRLRTGWGEGIFIVAAVVMLRLPSLLLSRWYDPDEAAIALQALAMQRGGTLYVDMADRKPPLPPLLYEFMFWLTGSVDIRPVRLVAALLLAAATIVLVRDVRRTHGQSVARWAGALFVIGALAFSPIDAGAANYAHFGLPLATIAIICCRRPGWRWALGGGVTLGLAILSRQSWLFAVPAGALSVGRVALAGETSSQCAIKIRSIFVSLVAFGAATLAAVLAAGFFVPLSGFTYWTFTSSPGFVFAGTDLGAAIVRGLAALGLFLLWHLALAAATLWSARLAAIRGNLDLWLWLVTGCLAVGAGLRFYGHYWMQLLPPMVLLAAPVLAQQRERLRKVAATTLLLGGATAWVLLFVPEVFRDRPSAALVAQYIREHTTTDQRVLVWGTFPELAVEVDRPTAGRLVHSDFVTGRSGGRDDPAKTLPTVTERPLEMFLGDVTGNPPEIIVDTSAIDSLGYTNYPLSVIPAL
ncbi:MAG: hypothetical protein ABIR32_16315, partial [Ilumatobacteraceae bacterium]